MTVGVIGIPPSFQKYKHTTFGRKIFRKKINEYKDNSTGVKFV